MLWHLSQSLPGTSLTRTSGIGRLGVVKGGAHGVRHSAYQPLKKPMATRGRGNYWGVIRRCSSRGEPESDGTSGKALKDGGGGGEKGLNPEDGNDKADNQKRPPWLLQVLQGMGCNLRKIMKQWWAQTMTFFILGLFGSRALLSVFSPTATVMYSDLLAFVGAGMVQSAQFEQSSDRVYFTLKPEYLTRVGNHVRISLEKNTKTDVKKGKGEKANEMQQMRDELNVAGESKSPGKTINLKLMARTLSGQSVQLHELLVKQKVRFGVVGSSLQSTMSRLMGTLAVLWIPLLPLFWFFRRSLNSQGNKKAKKVGSTAPRVLFSDVAGMEQAKLELMEVVSLLKNPERYSKLNIKVPSGILLCGPTGTGKTLLARAVAGEAGVPFFAASASEFVEMFVGRGAARIRELFKEARKNKPCVVFIDEIDSVGSRRGYSMNDERDQTLNQLLVELDGFEGGPGFVLLAATNRPDVLDSALLRPGRLTRKIQVSLPDETARIAILQLHLQDVPMESAAEKFSASAYIAKMTPGFSGAELANCVNEGAVLAARKDRDFVVLGDLISGVQRTRGRINSESGSDNIVQGLFDWISPEKRTPSTQAGS